MAPMFEHLLYKDGDAEAGRIMPETVAECHAVIRSLHDDLERACRHIDEISAGASGALTGEGQ